MPTIINKSRLGDAEDLTQARAIVGRGQIVAQDVKNGCQPSKQKTSLASSVMNANHGLADTRSALEMEQRCLNLAHTKRMISDVIMRFPTRRGYDSTAPFLQRSTN
jgi:hypothetical protein